MRPLRMMRDRPSSFVWLDFGWRPEDSPGRASQRAAAGTRLAAALAPARCIWPSRCRRPGLHTGHGVLSPSRSAQGVASLSGVTSWSSRHASLRGGSGSAAARLAVPGHGTEGSVCESDDAPAWRQGRGRRIGRAVPGLVLRVLLARCGPGALVGRRVVGEAQHGRCHQPGDHVGPASVGELAAGRVLPRRGC